MYQLERKFTKRVWLVPFKEFIDVIERLLEVSLRWSFSYISLLSLSVSLSLPLTPHFLALFMVANLHEYKCTIINTKQTPESDVLKKVLFIHSTGRCGSTLLSKVAYLCIDSRCLPYKMLNVIGGTVSLSEPDIFSVLTTWHMCKPDQVLYYNAHTGFPVSFIRVISFHMTFCLTSQLPAEIVQRIARCSTWLYARGVDPRAGSIAIKTRSFVVLIADQINRAVPESKVRLSTVCSLPSVNFIYPLNLFIIYCILFCVQLVIRRRSSCTAVRSILSTPTVWPSSLAA